MSLDSIDSEVELWETEPRVCHCGERKAERKCTPSRGGSFCLRDVGALNWLCATQLQRH